MTYTSTNKMDSYQYQMSGVREYRIVIPVERWSESVFPGSGRPKQEW